MSHDRSADDASWKFDGVLSCVICRGGQEPVVVHLDIPVVETPEEVHWLDDLHPHPDSK